MVNIEEQPCIFIILFVAAKDLEYFDGWYNKNKYEEMNKWIALRLSCSAETEINSLLS